MEKKIFVILKVYGALMISFTKTEVIIDEEDEEKENLQIDLDWWISRCGYFKDKYLQLEKENRELKKKLKKKLTSIF